MSVCRKDSHRGITPLCASCHEPTLDAHKRCPETIQSLREQLARERNLLDLANQQLKAALAIIADQLPSPIKPPTNSIRPIELE